ncbi:acetyl-CoA carboxylase carboxyltransferase subunit alpha/beta [Nocardia sp. NBC_01730]|uniref:carboxyl transferase domain-containing protein n=1 Tax=Nocardia sp. NBC_01730 TaxID=2975998 RepID=UPI002E136165|nr:acetyl-CoA carboxylase carboxyltransferase subunit alpha/beta [Nocardia sp. NBC_01730]
MSNHVSVRSPVQTLLSELFDSATLRTWHTALAPVDPGPEYARRLADARAKTGLDESIVAGEAQLHGHRLAVLACEFEFLAGSIGVAAAERLVTTIERATRERLPLLAVTASGGTRMQEGALAFVQMVKIAAAISDHKRAGLPFLVYLRHPSTGGVYASWASMGHLTFAEPDALIGFLGPRVVRALTGASLPDHVQRAENLRDHGLIDAVLTPSELPSMLSRILDLHDRPIEEITATPPAVDTPARPQRPDSWQSVLTSRKPDRLSARQLLHTATTSAVMLNGSAEGDAADQITTMIARVGGLGCVLIGYTEHPEITSGISVSDIRTARRAIRVAQDFALPVVTIIDTSGAQLSADAEEHGIAGQIARCMTELVTLTTATVSVLLGRGTGGAALALLPADRVIATEYAWLSPLAPEGASMLVHHDLDHAPQAAAELGIDSSVLAEHGIVDIIVGAGHGSTESLSAALRAAIESQLHELHRQTATDRYTERRRRYRMLGLRPTPSLSSPQNRS